MDQKKIDFIVNLRVEIKEKQKEADRLSEKLVSEFISETRKLINNKFGKKTTYEISFDRMDREFYHSITILGNSDKKLKNLERKCREEFKMIARENDCLFIE